MPIAHSDPYKVQEISHLKRQPRAAEALELLKRVALQVQPIMRKHQWTVRKLSEFVPKSSNLLGLNVNRGAEVKIRLRPPGQEDIFYPWEHVLGTMLHELCHNNIGPHNAAFYKLLDELWSEAEDLMDRGVTGTGQGFDAASVGRLGSYSYIPTHNPPQHKIADAVRKAAEARAQKAALMSAGPRKLGGSRLYKDMTPAQAAAAAAERRARDNMWCGAEHSPEQVQQEVGSRDVSPAGSTAPAPAAAASSAAGQRQQPASAAAVTGAGHRPGIATAAVISKASVHHQPESAVAPGGAAAAAAGTAAVQRQQSQQDSEVQREWQARLQRQQRQRQLQHHAARKRKASEAIDLTLSDDEDECAADGAGAAAAGAAATCSCPCCDVGSSEEEGAGSAPAAASGAGAASLFRVWCARRRQWLQDQQHYEPEMVQTRDQTTVEDRNAVSSPAAVAVGAEWSCPVCTLLNRALALQCEACLTHKPL